MRMLLIVAIVWMAACTKANEKVCCATEAQCAEIDLDELRPCGPGQACKSHSCVASECDSSADCPAENPICMDNVCVGSCTTDAQCPSASPLCEAGVCIGCRSTLDCPANASICDQQEHTCRGCRADDECTTGVCIEADAICAAGDQLVHVATSGTDTGTCTSTAPCETLTYAFQQVTGARNVIRVVGSFLAVPSTVTTNVPVIFDGSGTQITKPTTGPLLQVTNGNVTMEGFTIIGPIGSPTMPTISLSSGSLRLTKSTTNTALIDAVNATVVLDDVQVITGTPTDVTMVKCMSGTLTATRVSFQKTVIESQNCALTVQQSRHDGASDRSIDAFGGKVTIENNLIIESYEYADSMNIQGSAPGSVIRFNTFVNTSGINASGVALLCDNSQDVSNNIFAYRSTSPLSSPGAVACGTRYSLFDAVATPAARAGEGNRATEFALIFANANMKDFHLASTSDAKGGAQPNLLTVDFDGAPRPRPVGTNPDMGCYEAP